MAAASEFLFEAAIACPAHPGITFDGLAVDHTSTGDQVFVVVSIHDGALRTYLGPDRDTAQRRGSLVAAGLMSNPDIRLEVQEAAEVLRWLTGCWEVAHECLDTADERHGESRNDGETSRLQRRTQAALVAGQLGLVPPS